MAQGYPPSDAAAPSLLRLVSQLMRPLLVGCSASLWLIAPASAEGRKPQPTLVVSSQLWLSPGSENPLEVKVVPSDAIPPQSVIVIRGVPAGIRFSEGRPFGPGVWLVPATRLTGLKLHTPPDASSGGMMTVVLTTLEGTPVAEAQITVISVPPSKPNAENTTSSSVEPPSAFPEVTQQSAPATPNIAPAPANRADLLMLLEKGKESLRLGNILIARQFYQRAADKGLAEAAFALALTYDRNELPRMKGMGDVAPDPQLARKWYEKARELGSPEAEARLSQLSRP
jgi:hypothetical protein